MYNTFKNNCKINVVQSFAVYFMQILCYVGPNKNVTDNYYFSLNSLKNYIWNIFIESFS